MKEEEEDRLLLNSLGVTSANPEDIERDILTEAKKDAEGRSDAGDCTEEQFLNEEQLADPSDTNRVKLLNKLRAIEVEIDAVAASVEQARTVTRNDDSASDSISNGEEGNVEQSKNTVRDSIRGLTLQHALASDRLRSLKKTKAHLQKELNELDENGSIKGIENGMLLDKLVGEEPKRRRRFKETKSTPRNSKKAHKAVSFDEDVDFDVVLDAASTGFVETVNK